MPEHAEHRSMKFWRVTATHPNGDGTYETYILDARAFSVPELIKEWDETDDKWQELFAGKAHRITIERTG